MVESPGRTVVCSVLFLDIADYSKKSVAEQAKLKQRSNDVLSDALESVASHDRVILDTGDGAAIAFLADPEDALFVALAIRDKASDLPLRMGINLGPARLVKDLNGQVNIIGDGINVAQRVMSFSEPGQLLVSRSYYEVVSCLSDHYANLFTHQGARTDKHVREHQVYSVGSSTNAVRFNPLTDSFPSTVESGLTTPTMEVPTVSKEEIPDAPARVLDAGANLIISGTSRASVQKALDTLAKNGARLISPITQVSSKWMATCEHPKIALSACKVQSLGHQRIVTGPTSEAVAAKVDELVRFGAVLVSAIRLQNGVWTAVCDTNG